MRVLTNYYSTGSIKLSSLLIHTVGIAFLAIAAVASGTSPDGPLYPFGIDSLLECHLDNPQSGLPGQPDTFIEEPPRLGFAQVVNQEGHPYVIWLPENTRYT